MTIFRVSHSGYYTNLPLAAVGGSVLRCGSSGVPEAVGAQGAESVGTWFSIQLDKSLSKRLQ